ncbi:MAG: cytochrome C [Opitutaceae bacterium]|nr:cytochrome C [Opitutaceae bacterium]
MASIIMNHHSFSTIAAYLGLAASLAGPLHADPSAKIEHGRYLVEQVAMCADCHSPRGEKGAFIVGKEYTGAPLGFAPTVPMPAWADTAPFIAGLPNYTTEQAVKFFVTGERPTGVPVRPPMPEYRMCKEDTEAVVAYLQTVKLKF